MPLIRTVFQPDSPREVDDQEAKQLEREGLLLPLEAAAALEPKPVAAAAVPTPVKEAIPDGGKQGQ